ncbi:hypothetical protein B0T16DRAFT_212339 [Cercophora newfieldiana]|uniref:Uncharacterized protein n=1 Tax=Cercophora newfieldiana TaxID=92897 RepID=A0AA39XVX6_9PEZI|nr:hypothetical protein B0T16DRAFT_212339 [Cercophora newfieldiana]
MMLLSTPSPLAQNTFPWVWGSSTELNRVCKFSRSSSLRCAAARASCSEGLRLVRGTSGRRGSRENAEQGRTCPPKPRMIGWSKNDGAATRGSASPAWPASHFICFRMFQIPSDGGRPRRTNPAPGDITIPSQGRRSPQSDPSAQHGQSSSKMMASKLLSKQVPNGRDSHSSPEILRSAVNKALLLDHTRAVSGAAPLQPATECTHAERQARECKSGQRAAGLGMQTPICHQALQTSIIANCSETGSQYTTKASTRSTSHGGEGE